MELEDMINRADVIDVASLTGKDVKFGATVKLVDEDTDAEVTYQIVGDFEADLEQRKISISSPLPARSSAKALVTVLRSTRRRQ